MSLDLVKMLILAASATCGANGWTQSCSLINQGKSEVKNVAGAAIELPAPHVNACAGLRVVKGAVVACTVGSRGRSACKTYKAGQTLSQADMQRSESGSGAWYTLTDILRGSPGRVIAVSRGRDGRSLPTGAVAILQPLAIDPDFDADPALRGIESIEIREGDVGDDIVATLSAKGVRTLPSSKLKSGKRYHWRINPAPGNLPVTGEFMVLSEAERREARAEAERVRLAAPGDATAQAVMWAGWLASRRCEHEAAQILSGTGFDVD